MGLRGPAPTPTRLRLLTGNPSGRPLNNDTDLVASLQELPPPPDMDGFALATWHRLTAELATLGMLNDIDTDLLSMYCHTWADYTEYRKKLKQFGEIVKAPSGYPIQSPYVNMAVKARHALIRMQQELGMSPSSRSRVKMGGGTGAKSRAAKSKLGRFLAAKQLNKKRP